MRSTAIIKSQIIDHAQFRRLLSYEFFVVELFVLQAAKKALGWRVVPTIPSAAHALLHLHYRQMLAVFPAHILAASVGVIKQTGRRLPAPEGHLQSFNTQRRPHMLINRPAHDLAGKQIDHDSDIKPALQRRYRRDIGRPHLIWLGHLKLPIQAIGRNGLIVIAVGRDFKPLGIAYLQLQVSHEPPRLETTDGNPLFLQAIGQTTRTKALLIVAKNLPRYFSDFLIVLMFVAILRSLAPGIIGTGTHRHHLTQHGHWIGLLLLLNKPILHSVSFAKKTAVFFNSSRSIRSCSFSLRKRINSS